jgi:hypothetical protein
MAWTIGRLAPEGFMPAMFGAGTVRSVRPTLDLCQGNLRFP